MSTVTAIALFCEDIRREVTGKETLIGVYADGVNLAKLPGKIRRLVVYFRIRLDVNESYPNPILPGLEFNGEPFDSETPLEPIPIEMIERSMKRSKERGAPYATIGGRINLREPVHVSGPGNMVAYVKVGDQRQTCGVLTIAQRREDTSQPIL